jgi:FkbM family methyltransferase
MTTSELLSETVDAARCRESSAFVGLRSQAAGGIVLFGAGRLGKKAAIALRKQGIEPLAFADNDPKLQGTTIDGIPVFSPPAAAEHWRKDALFVVTTFRPVGGGVSARVQELAALGCPWTANFLHLGWKYDGVLPHFGSDLPSQLLSHAGELAHVAELWNDDISRETFRQELAWRLQADFTDSSMPAPDQYFPKDILRPNLHEIFVDGGAYDGDTLRAAPWPLDRIVAIEPDPENATRLRTMVCGRVQLCEVLLGRTAGSARFDGSGTMASSRSDSGSLEIPVASLDDLVAGEHPTFIKLDVEGDELAALQGARRTLCDSQPLLAVCAYHRPEDLRTIPLFLREALPKHRMYLRAHAWDGFELVAYAVPADRCVQP